MNFTRQSVRLKRRWITPELYGLLLNEFKREGEYGKAHPKEDFVPYMEGDPFTDSQEYPTSFRVGKASVSDDSAKVTVTFLWGSKNSSSQDQRNTVIELVRNQGAWVIRNIVQADGRDLLTDLKREKYLP